MSQTQERKGAVKWRGAPTDLLGPELKVSDRAPSDFTVVGPDMAPVSGQALTGKPRVVCAPPTLNAPACDVEMKHFITEAENIPGVSVYGASLDLPFDQTRWCGATGSVGGQPRS